MANKPISVEDHVLIQNLMGKYQQLVDDGKSDAWASLWTEDGEFAGGLPVPYKGTAKLKEIPSDVEKNFGDKLRHHMGSFYTEYGANTDEAIARFYSLVTTWKKEEGAKFFCMSLCTVTLLRINGTWKIKKNDVKQFNNF